jgi:TnpA family transposase
MKSGIWGWEDQRYHATGLTLHTAAITLWNTVYIERTIEPLKQKGVPVNELLVSHPSPLLYKI